MIAGPLVTSLLAAATAGTLPPEEPPPSFGILEETTLAGRGVTRAGWQIELRAGVAGTLSRVAAEGDRVSAGDEVARVDDAVARAQLAAAENRANRRAAVERAGVDEQRAKRRLDRVRAAVAEGSAQEWELREAEADHAAAAAAVREAGEVVRGAEAEVAVARAALARHALIAARAGEVVRVHAEAGAWVAERDVVAEVADLSTLRADLFVDSGHAATLNVGDRRWLVRPDSGAAVAATVEYVDPRLDPASGRRRCVFIIANRDRRLPAGFEVALPAASVASVE